MCIFWFKIVAKLDDQDDAAKWFFHPLWKKNSFDFYSGQVGRPGWGGQVVFSASIKKKKNHFHFKKLEKKAKVDKAFSS